MATTINPPRTVTLPSPMRTTTTPCGCPSCGGLECLCRPRFFAGQLLTEEDLNRLDSYVVAKNKLHNRYLHGWGVVCGLDVQCDTCASGSVIVTPGYALSPCGEDVIVCADQEVPICDLIASCKPSTADCMAPTATTGCNDGVQQWVLAICYAESPSRGVVPLRSTSGCGCGCSGNGGCGCNGGSKSGGCGCGGGGTKKKNGWSMSSSSSTSGCGCGGSSSSGTVATTSASRGASLMQCENTVVCESYTFRVYKAPRTTTDQKNPSRGALTDAFIACVTEFVDAMPEFTPPTTSQQDQHDWCCAMHDAWTDWFMTHPGYACQLAQRIAAIPCPRVGDQNFDAALNEAENLFMLGALEVLISCLCKALMPPCSAAPTDDCIPLAVVTVDNTNGCNVVSICNWTTQRKYVTTFPSLQYWLSFLPFGRLLREALESLCCRSFIRRVTTQDATSQPPITEDVAPERRAATAKAEATNTQPGTSAKDISPSTYFRPTPRTMTQSRDFMQLALQTLTDRATSANGEELVLGMTGGKDVYGESPLTDLESENLLQFIVLDQMAKPTLRNVLSDKVVGGGLDSVLNIFGSMFGGAGSEKAAAAPDVTAQLDELRAMVKQQQSQIDELTKSSRNKKK